MFFTVCDLGELGEDIGEIIVVDEGVGVEYFIAVGVVNGLMSRLMGTDMKVSICCKICKAFLKSLISIASCRRLSLRLTILLIPVLI